MPWRKTADDRRRDATRYGAEWKKARQDALRRANGRCEICGSRKDISVDHIYGAAQDPQHHHLQVLCGEHHRAKTGREAGHRNSSSDTDPPANPRTQW